MMWNNVDFPEPEGPTIERNSPAGTSRSTPRKASTDTLPVKYVLRSPLTLIIASPLFIRQRLDRVLAHGDHARIKRPQQRRADRDEARNGPPTGHNRLRK